MVGSIKVGEPHLPDMPPVLQVRAGPQEPTETGRWHWVNVELVGAEEHVPVLHEDPPRRGRPDACSTDTGCRVLLSGAAGMEKDVLFSALRANVLRGGCLPTQQGSGGAAFTSPLSRLEGELPPNGATNDQNLAIQRGRIRTAWTCAGESIRVQAFSEILSAIHRMGCVLCTVPPGPSPRMGQDNHDQRTIMMRSTRQSRGAASRPSSNCNMLHPWTRSLGP